MAFRSPSRGRLVARIHDVGDREIGFRLGSGRPALDLVATVGERWRRSYERLRSPDDLQRWLVATHIAETKPGRPPTAADLVRVRNLRAAVFACLDAAIDGRRLPTAALATINAEAAHPPATPVLSAHRKVRTV